jgi:hypothetical protein
MEPFARDLLFVFYRKFIVANEPICSGFALFTENIAAAAAPGGC